MTVTLELEIRKERKKSGARKLRRAGYTPGVIYGAHEETLPVKVPTQVLQKFLRELHGEQVVLELKIDGKTLQGLVQDVQRDPVTGEPIHVDFLVLHAGEAVEVTVPLVLVGEAPGVKMGGILEHLLHEVDVRALPAHLPPHIEVDVSGLGLGDVLRVKELRVPEGVEILEDPEEPIVVISVPRGVEEAPEAEEGGEAEEGQAGPEGGSAESE